MRMMIIVATSAKNIAIAPPDRSECSPISSFVKPRLSDPMSPTTARSLGRAWEEFFIHDIFPSEELKERLDSSSIVHMIAPIICLFISLRADKDILCSLLMQASMV